MGKKARVLGINEEPYDYTDDLKILTVKEKREILKNAKRLLALQKDDVEIPVEALIPNQYVKQIFYSEYDHE